MKAIVCALTMMVCLTSLAQDQTVVEKHQVLFLADSGVVVLQVTVLMDGKGPKQRFEASIDSLLKRLDKDGDGVVTVGEAKGKILTAKEAQQMQLIGAEGAPADASPDISPKDGKISRAELLAYFKRIGLLPFSVTFQPRNVPRDIDSGQDSMTPGDVPLFAKLDVNNDKKLSVDELKNALEVLKKLDRDDDETISAAELLPLVNQPQAANRRGMNNPPPAVNPFLCASSGESMPKLIRRLVDKYDSADAAKSGVPSLSTRNQKLSRMELGLAEEKFNQFDVDGDGQLDFAELRQFVTAPRSDWDVVIDISAGKAEAQGNYGVDARSTADGAVNLQFGSALISILATQPNGSVDAEQLIMPVFTALDMDANGYLEKNEAPEEALMGATFVELDADKDGKLYLKEFVEHLNPRLELVRSRLQLSIVEQGRTLFDILDFDRDGRLAHREVRSVADKLNLWDTNGDGCLMETEIPLQFRMIGEQGELPFFDGPRNAVAGNQPRAVPSRPNGPAWFSKMDRNRDGEISRREFLGEIELFEKIDLNHDGAIELLEAMQVKAN